ncbi:MAG: helix-turn-helix domain-containing protein [Desulfobacterales bacterium]
MTTDPEMGTMEPIMGAEGMDDTIAEVLFGKTRRAILGLLFSHPEQAFFLRQIARSVDSGMGAVQRELRQLTDAGILTKTASGRQVYFQSNPKCPVFNELRLLVAKTIGIADELKSALLPLGERIVCAFVYGSMASGRVTLGSDVDLMVIGELSFGEVVSALHPVQDVLCREINPTVYPEAEFAEKLAQGHHFLKSVLSEEKIFLVGDANELEKLAGQRLAGGTSL